MDLPAGRADELLPQHRDRPARGHADRGGRLQRAAGARDVADGVALPRAARLVRPPRVAAGGPRGDALGNRRGERARGLRGGQPARRGALGVHAPQPLLRQARRPADRPLLRARLRALGPPVVVAARAARGAPRRAAHRAGSAAGGASVGARAPGGARLGAGDPGRGGVGRRTRLPHRPLRRARAGARADAAGQGPAPRGARRARALPRRPLAGLDGRRRPLRAHGRREHGAARAGRRLDGRAPRLEVRLGHRAAGSRSRRALPHRGRGGTSRARGRSRGGDRDGPLDPRGLTVPAAAEGNFVEVFSSVQGEGPHVGASTLFIRLGACDLRCRWCDSPHTWKPAETCRLETKRGAGAFETLPNPVPIAAIVAAAERLELAAHAFVSITGGEPLLQPEVVAALAAALRGRGPRIHLETHGLAVAALAQVVEQVDLVAMDWKLASDVRRAGESWKAQRPDFHDEHEAFLRVAARAPEVFVKIVVTPATRDEEVLEAARRIARTAPRSVLVLQPVTPRGGVAERPAPGRVLALAAAAERILRDVRVIPQTHPIYGVP
ncbi:MAG: hypothetical protein DCC71_24750 [Proteobacteria bacterium]|nr:MAG: hypothetical protein DCC71_24750 [Pseudomonadota bacterium]